MKQKPISAAENMPVAGPARANTPRFPEGLLEHAVGAVFTKLSQRPLSAFAKNYWQTEAAALEALRGTRNDLGEPLETMKIGSAA